MTGKTENRGSAEGGLALRFSGREINFWGHFNWPFTIDDLLFIILWMRQAVKARFGLVTSVIRAYPDNPPAGEDDISGKTNGCATGGSPDKNDWITTCDGQNQVYPLIMEAIELLENLI